MDGARHVRSVRIAVGADINGYAMKEMPRQRPVVVGTRSRTSVSVPAEPQPIGSNVTDEEEEIDGPS